MFIKFPNSKYGKRKQNKFLYEYSRLDKIVKITRNEKQYSNIQIFCYKIVTCEFVYSNWIQNIYNQKDILIPVLGLSQVYKHENIT